MPFWFHVIFISLFVTDYLYSFYFHPQWHEIAFYVLMCRYETTHSLTLVLTIVSQICINYIDVIVITVKCTYWSCDFDLWYSILQNHATSRISQGHSYTKFGHFLDTFLSYTANIRTDRRTDRQTNRRTNNQTAPNVHSQADRQPPSHWLLWLCVLVQTV